MNCRRVEKLIPLYVEGDLASSKATDLSAHLEWCGRCNWLADEFRESQSWLRTSESPEFDQAFLEDFKSGVLRRIERVSTKPSPLAVLMQQWTRRQIFALSTAMLVILGVVVFYIYQTTSTQLPMVIADKQADSEGPLQAEPPQVRDTGTAPEASSGQHHPINQARRKARTASSAMANRTIEPPPPVQPTPFVEDSLAGSAQPADVAPAGGSEFPQMLRIEIQTSDPSIRIIWFAPKETDIPKTTN